MALAHLLVLGVGGLMVGIPVLLHLLMQPKPKQLVFPALRFVREMQNTNQRSLQMRHWVLLALRCLLILALVAALARPSTTSAAFGNWMGFGAGGILSILTGILFTYAMFWSKPANLPLALVIGAVLALLLAYTTFTGIQAIRQNGGASILSDQTAPVATVLIVDSSPRMSYRFENQSRLEKAKHDGRWLIGNLPPGSRVSIVANDGDRPFFSVDISAAKKRLETLDFNYNSRTIPETLSQAIRLIAESELERKEIYILTDLTSESWAQTSAQLAKPLAENPDVSLYVMDVGIESPTNYTVGQLALSADAIPARGQLEIETQLRSAGEGKTLVLKLMLEKPDKSRPRRSDGKTLVPEDHWTRVTNIDVASDAATTARLILQDDLAEGIHHGWVEIESSDSLQVDDRRFFTIEVRPRWDVLVVHPSNVDPARLVDAMGGEGQDGGTFDVKIVKQKDLASEPDLNKYRAVYLLNPKPVSDPLWKILEEYAIEGGSLGIFLGHNASAGSGPADSFQTEQSTRVLQEYWPGFGAVRHAKNSFLRS